MHVPIKYHEGKFPPKNIDWEMLVPLIGPATAALARYDGLLMAIPNATVLLSPLTTKEAVLSSRIEGTQATMGEVLEYEAEKGEKAMPPDKAADINEILNYRKAMWEAEKLLGELPLCNRVLKEAHKILLTGVRGQSKSPGEYRKIPNWIGPHGCRIEEARYIPISADKLEGAMSDWEKYLNSYPPDVLVQLGLVHAEFEALHPFLDGNGRLGRMCVPLFLFHRKVIHRPMFFISEYFEKNRDEYYERLLSVSRNDRWTEWCVFFLKAVKEQAQENQSKAESILKLYNSKKTEISYLLRSQYTIQVVDFIFQWPIFNTTDFVTAKIPTPAARAIVKKLKDSGSLKEIRPGSGSRPAILAFPDLINIVEGSNVL